MKKIISVIMIMTMLCTLVLSVSAARDIDYQDYNLINIYQPEVLSIGGGLSGEKDYLLAPLLPMILSEQYTRSMEPKTVIRIAELGNDAGIIGAAALGR